MSKGIPCLPQRVSIVSARPHFPHLLLPPHTDVLILPLSLSLTRLLLQAHFLSVLKLQEVGSYVEC